MKALAWHLLVAFARTLGDLWANPMVGRVQQAVVDFVRPFYRHEFPAAGLVENPLQHACICGRNPHAFLMDATYCRP